MENLQKSLEFIDWFEEVLNTRPGMLGSIAEITAMFLVVDNIRSLLLHGERLAQDLSWNQFLIERNLLRDLKSVPIEEAWDLDRFIALRHEYLRWVEDAE